MKILTVDQFNDQTIPRLHLTSETLTWDPSTTTYADQEAAMMDFTGAVETRTRVRDRFPAVIRAMATIDLTDLFHDNHFAQALLAQVIVSQIDIKPDQIRPVQTLSPDQRRPDQIRQPHQTGTQPALTGNVRARKIPGLEFLTLARRRGISP